MVDGLHCTQPETKPSQNTPAQASPNAKQGMQQRSTDPIRLPLYLQAWSSDPPARRMEIPHTPAPFPMWGNQPPPWLRLPVQRQASPQREPPQQQQDASASPQQENTTGLPDTLKAGVEKLSGLSLDDVQVHYHSPEPARVQALAYTQGTHIYVKSGQERYLAHEAWHVVQQKQGRVKPTWQAKGMAINDDEELEKEADVMGDKVRLWQPSARLLDVSKAQVGAGMSDGTTSRHFSHSSPVQLARGIPRYGLASHRFPPMPAPQPNQWVRATVGPYYVSTQMDVILTPNWGHLQGGPPVNTKFYLDVYPRNNQINSLYHRGHILAQSLKGPGDVYNMVPLTETTNYAMRDLVENPIRGYVTGQTSSIRGVIWYRVSITYGQGPAANRSIPERFLPTRVYFALREYQSPEDPNQLGTLAAWLQNDPEPYEPVNIPAYIDMVLPNFAAPLLLAQHPTYSRYSAIDQRINNFRNSVNILVGNLNNRHINAVAITQRLLRIDDYLQGLGVGYGITQEDQQDPAVQYNQLNAYLDTQGQLIQDRYNYLIRAAQTVEDILEMLDHVDVDDLETLQEWENTIGNVMGLANNADLHQNLWEAAHDTVVELRLFVEGEYQGTEDLEGLNAMLANQLRYIRGFL